MAQLVKNLHAVWETWVLCLGWEDPLEKGMATHSSILVWRIPWTEEPGGLQFHRVAKSRTRLSDFIYSLIPKYHKNFFLIYAYISHQETNLLNNSLDYSPPGSSVHGIFQARILEWVAIFLSRGSSQPRDRTQVSLIAGRRFNL